ncbi:hypothetical protein E1264_32330 [Actinomadura sp. KC216]|uniref:hypothetical protein n=1 Tax=Actinomadura sp. KC216 TaxID=2530370 RepID=UPI00104E1868|nr:hypothetical protein [Actinomadura sp. KC216]TDB81721.1 hypothetical protein E1264_32330 [Actinomadura sp. KC216]
MIEWDVEALARLRSAVHRGDWAAGLELLQDRPLEPVLQYAGDVALMAAARGRAEGAWLANDCRALLAERGWPGDAELAAELSVPLGHGRAAGLLPLPADLGAVAAAMEDGFHVLDLERGDVLLAGEIPTDETHDPGRWLPIPPGILPEGEDARRGTARHWLAEQGYRPIPRTL